MLSALARIVGWAGSMEEDAAPSAARQPPEAGIPGTSGDVKRENREDEEKLSEASPSAAGNDEKEKALHQEPAGECLVCFDPLEKRNYAEYALQSASCSPPQKEENVRRQAAAEDPKVSEAADISAASEQLKCPPSPRGEGPAEGEAAEPSSEAACCSAAGAQKLVWYPAKFCKDCIEELQAVQFQRYCHSVANTNCAREQRALLKRGPPVNLRDRMAFPESNDEEIYLLWYAADNKVRPAKLKDSLEGEKRQALWNWLEQFVIEDEQVVEDVNGKRTENA